MFLWRWYLNKRRVIKKKCNILDVPSLKRAIRLEEILTLRAYFLRVPAASSGNFQNVSLTTNPFLLSTIMDFNGSSGTSKQSSRVFARAFPFQLSNPRVK